MLLGAINYRLIGGLNIIGIIYLISNGCYNICNSHHAEQVLYNNSDQQECEKCMVQYTIIFVTLTLFLLLSFHLSTCFYVTLFWARQCRYAQNIYIALMTHSYFLCAISQGGFCFLNHTLFNTKQITMLFPLS